MKLKDLNENTIWILKAPSTGEYRVPALNKKESGAYYTDDKEDAIETAKIMYKGKNMSFRFKSKEHS